MFTFDTLIGTPLGYDPKYLRGVSAKCAQAPKYLRPSGPARPSVALRRTQQALAVSAMSLVLCSTMLVGTTFAWFQQSVQLTSAPIQPGYLKTTFSYWNGESYVPMEEGKTTFFEDVAWEPGTVKLLYIKVENQGVIDLDYKLGLDIAKNTLGQNLDGEEIDMTKLLSYAILLPTEDHSLNLDSVRELDLEDRQVRYQLRQAEGMALLSEAEKDEVLLGSLPAPGEGEDPNASYMALVVCMPAQVGMEANHDGKAENCPKVQLELNISAIQSSAEYDLAVEADGLTLAEAIDQADSGDTIALMTDVVLDSVLFVDKDLHILGNGHTITAPNAFSAFWVDAGSKLSLENAALVHEMPADADAETYVIPQVFSGSGQVKLDTCTLEGWADNDTEPYTAE